MRACCLFSQYDGTCTERIHSDGTPVGASFLYRVPRWDPTAGKAEMEADARRGVHGVCVVLCALCVCGFARREKTQLANPLSAEGGAQHRSVSMRGWEAIRWGLAHSAIGGVLQSTMVLMCHRVSSTSL